MGNKTFYQASLTCVMKRDLRVIGILAHTFGEASIAAERTAKTMNAEDRDSLKLVELKRIGSVDVVCE